MKIKLSTVMRLIVSTVMYDKIYDLVYKEFSHWVDVTGPIEGTNDRRMNIDTSRLISDFEENHNNGDDESLKHQRCLVEFKKAFSSTIFADDTFDFGCVSLIQVEEDVSDIE